MYMCTHAHGINYFQLLTFDDLGCSHHGSHLEDLGVKVNVVPLST